jgi:hypothetical protein
MLTFFQKTIAIKIHKKNASTSFTQGASQFHYIGCVVTHLR